MFKQNGKKCAFHHNVWAMETIEDLGNQIQCPVQSCIWLYLKRTSKIQIPSVMICLNMHVLLVKCCVKPSTPLSQKSMRNNTNDSEM